MRTVRIYHPEQLTIDTPEVQLSYDAFNHLIRVLRLQQGAQIELFHEPTQQAQATLSRIDKKSAWITLNQIDTIETHSPLTLHLGQVISRGEKMEFTIQKAVELGVNKITPLLSERCGVKLNDERFEKKLRQWQNIAIAACEQCGRNDLPRIMPIQPLESWCNSLALFNKENNNTIHCLNLHPKATQSIKSLPESIQNIALLIGPEGGLTDSEIQMTESYGFEAIQLGPRVLRTETAAMVTMTALQVHLGDLG